MRDRDEQGSIVSLLCDRGDRYDETLFDTAWLQRHGIDPQPECEALRRCLANGASSC